ncbi:ribose transport system ATP-binding protein [Amaricoccus macauensis]|uniref:Ribose transport system ATP-binding protein n=1 Tax=Amaricoccus macauensis TaxID=57001 RepID=A0A840SNB6_9RHOB|nr:sugar ABC transporter ATP-binding protein [Amaricoccus macauensis]MBB5221798.1 ribose transport system ATP-binding protein [Amaricoccus macauensis]
MTAPFLELLGVSKSYPGVVALDDVSLAVHPGEVIGLVGENGAGKSTLMKILGGVTGPSLGRIRVDGAERAAMTVADAIGAGIAFVHQELNLFDNLDAASNVFIGREPLKGGPLKLVDRARLRAAVRPLFARLGVDFSPDTPVAGLSLAQRQLVEIAKALSLDSRLVIMDEPTSSLTLTETERLLKVIADLKASGVSVIFISHRLDEVRACADRVVGLRDGRVAGHLAKAEITPPAMIRLMIGRDLKAIYRPPATEPGSAVLEARGVTTATYPTQTVDLAVHRGEILGLAGLIGAGRTELARALFGIDAMKAGEVRLDGHPVAISSPRDAIAAGLFLVPEDRKGAGVVLDLPIKDNVTLPQVGALARFGIIRRPAERAMADTERKRLGIRAPSIFTNVGTLSGGNQQKVVLAKWLAMKPRAIVFDEPTRGIDVGAKREIYDMMRGLADAGVAVLMISSDMEEVIGVSDRIAVMHEGAIAGVLERRDFSERKVLELAVGEE